MVEGGRRQAAAAGAVARQVSAAGLAEIVTGGRTEGLSNGRIGLGARQGKAELMVACAVGGVR